MDRIYKTSFKIFLCLIFLVQQVHAVTITVTNTLDNGAGSFRAALQAAQNGDVINFNLGAGPYVIKPLTAYSISRKITIDGLRAGKPGVEFDGLLGNVFTCFDMNSTLGSGTVIQGLVLNNFNSTTNPNSAAITISQASGVTVKSCYIGTDMTGLIAKPNNHGIWINGSSNNIIGGTNVTDGNLISGNKTRGVWVSAQGGTASNNTTENNTVGMDINGAALPNYTGIEYQLGASNNLIKHNNVRYNLGDGLSFNQTSTGNRVYGNVFAYNGEHGVDFLNNTVMNNIVGVDINGVGEPNEIFNNAKAGVFVSEWQNDATGVYQGGAPSKVTVRKNKIYCNGVKGIALIESPAGAVGNGGKASPVINPLSNEEKTFGTAGAGDIIDIYVADACNACNSGNSQGQTWLTSIVATNGTWTYTNPTTGGAQCYSLIVTASDGQGNTSEFASSCVLPKVVVRDTTTCSTVNLTLDVTQPCALGYRWSTGAETPAVSIPNAAPGLYWVEAKGIDNVWVRANFEIRQSASFTVDLGSNLNRCNDPFTPVAILDPNLPNNMTYLWSTGSTSPSIAVNRRGRYFVKVTDPATNCSNADTMDILPNVIPAPLLQNAQFCPGDSVTLKPGNFTSYRWSDGSTGPNLKVKTGGVYWVVVTNASGCTDSVSATVTVFPKPILTIANMYVCPGSTANLTAGNGFSTYQWSSGETTAGITNKGAGAYTVNVTDNNGCKTSAAPQIINHPNPVVSISPRDPNICAGQSVELDANTQNVLYKWSMGSAGPVTNTTQKITVTQAGNYVVLIEDANGCKAKDSVTVNLFPQDVANFTTTPYCAGTTPTQPVFGADNTPGGVFSFTATDGATINSSTGVITNGIGGTTYAIKYVTPGTCKDSITKNIQVFALPALSISDIYVCPGSTASLTAGAGFVSYNWSSGETTAGITNKGAGTYTVNVTDNNGCAATAAPQVINHLNPVVSISPRDTNICAGNSVELDGNTQNVIYKWSIGSQGAVLNTTQKITVNQAGNYVVLIEDINGCKATDSVTVGIIPQDVADFTTSSYCEGAIPTQPVFGAGNTAGGIFSFVSVVLDDATINAATGVVTNGKGGATYAIQYETPGSCKASKTVNLLVLKNPVFTLQPRDVTLCAATPATFEINATDALTYQWQLSTDGGASYSDLTEGSPYTGTQTTRLTIDPVDPTLDLAKFRSIARAGACEAISDPGTIIFGKAIALSNPTAQPVCPNATVKLTSSAPGAVSYQWEYSSDGITFLSLSNGGVYSNVTSSELTILVTAAINGFSYRNTAVGCVNADISDPAVISLIPETQITRHPTDSAVCVGKNAGFFVTAINALSYQWYVNVNNGLGYVALSNGADYSGSTTNALTVNAAKAAMDGYSYHAIATGTCGPVTSNPAVLSVTDPKVIFVPETPVCPGATVTLTATSNYTDATYAWSNGKTGSSILETITKVETFTVTVSRKGCTHAASGTIDVLPIPVPVVRNDTTVCPGKGVQLNVTLIPGYTYSWRSIKGDFASSDFQPVVSPQRSTTYIVTVNNTVCPYSLNDSVTVNVIEDMQLYFPNAFTPNEDLTNDLFKVEGQGVVEFDAIIFDRWGKAIYQWNSVDGGWDGKTDEGPEIKNDVYVLKMNARGVCTSKQSYLETITVIK